MSLTEIAGRCQKMEPEHDLDLDAIFPEPPRPPSPEATTAVYKRKLKQQQDERSDKWDKIIIRLVGNHSLWGHHLWNAAICLASYLDEHPELYRDKGVLELGAGGALPSIVVAKNSAARVVVTDYPDHELISNISHNICVNIHEAEVLTHVDVLGYVWGRSVEPLLAACGSGSSRKFDLIILSDLVFNHSQHEALLQTCSQTASESAVVLVFYTHHRPLLAHKDLKFFELARAKGWICDEVVTERFDPMFPDDPGEEDVRATVHGWTLVRSSPETAGVVLC